MYNLKLKGRIIEVFGAQWRFAQHLGLHEALVSRTINRRQELSPKKKRQWAKVLNVEPGEIFEE